MTDAPRRCGAAVWSLSGEKRTLRDHHKSVVPDPKRRFAAINCRIAKGTLALDVETSNF